MNVCCCGGSDISCPSPWFSTSDAVPEPSGSPGPDTSAAPVKLAVNGLPPPKPVTISRSLAMRKPETASQVSANATVGDGARDPGTLLLGPPPRHFPSLHNGHTLK